MRKPRITLSDVAAEAGVSATTASLVLGGKTLTHRISADTHQRILEAAKTLDYVPNRLVHSMQKGSTQILSFFDGFRNRHANDLYLIFFAPQPDDPLLPYLRNSRLPTVLLGASDQENVLSSVKDDVESGMRLIADRLYELGHRRIAVAPHVEHLNVDRDERIGLLSRFMAEKGVRIQDGPEVLSDNDGETLYTYIKNSPEMPTAIFCWRDFQAYCLLESCEKRGLRVPQDLTVVGYDGLAWPMATRHKAASIKVDFEMLSETAVSLLIDSIHKPVAPPIQKKIPVTLYDGTTLAPPHADKPRASGEQR
jgi:LacI family transcriptional regulator